MKINRKEVIEVLTSDGKVINEGDTVVVFAYGKCHLGVFKGLTKRNALILDAGNHKDETIEYVISCKCVDSIYKGEFNYEN